MGWWLTLPYQATLVGAAVAVERANPARNHSSRLVKWVVAAEQALGKVWVLVWA